MHGRKRQKNTISSDSAWEPTTELRALERGHAVIKDVPTQLGIKPRVQAKDDKGSTFWVPLEKTGPGDCLYIVRITKKADVALVGENATESRPKNGTSSISNSLWPND